MQSRICLKWSSSKIATCVALFSTAQAFATPSLYAPGSALTTGGFSNPYQLSSLAYNPASAALLLKSNERVRIGYLSSFGTGTEFGDINNFEDEINDLADELDRDDLALDDAESIVDRFNAVLPTIGQNGYMKLISGGSLPLMPAVFKFDQVPGHFFVEGATELLIGGSFLDAPVTTRVVGSSASVTTESSLYLKSGTNLRFGLGYAQPVWSGGSGWTSGQLILGSKLNVHRLSLSKQVISLNDVDDVGNVVEDDYDKNELTTTGASLNLGAIWRAERYQLGFTVNNINEPTFDYGEVGTNCAALSGDSQNNCFQANAFAADGRIDKTESHTMFAYSKFDASFSVLPNLMLGFSTDLGEHEDFLGDDYQWTTVSMFYQPNHWAVPGTRIGYRSNAVGSELSSVMFGMTLFRNANFDIEYGLDSTEIDGSSAPRNFAFNFGFEEHF